MRDRLLTGATLVALLAPATLVGQGIGIGARAGTLGIGAEGAVGLTESLVVRGGIGVMPFEPSVDIDEINFTLQLPDTWYNLGFDLYLAGPFRIGGGMLYKPDNPILSAQLIASTDIGGTMYTPAEVGTLTATLESKSSVPYAVFGFGRHNSPGFGLFLDLGVAFLGEPDFSLAAEGGTLISDPAFQSSLRAEEANLEDEAGPYLKYWPILNVGFHIGIG
jgi:hypothetical protein